jgi:hypothetical protein
VLDEDVRQPDLELRELGQPATISFVTRWNPRDPRLQSDLGLVPAHVRACEI